MGWKRAGIVGIVISLVSLLMGFVFFFVFFKKINFIYINKKKVRDEEHDQKCNIYLMVSVCRDCAGLTTQTLLLDKYFLILTVRSITFDSLLTVLFFFFLKKKKARY
jgi:hypothetical protein